MSTKTHARVYSERFSREIKSIRKQLRWLRNQAARAAGVNPSYWTLFERDGYVPSRATIGKLVAAFVAAGIPSERAELLYLHGTYAPPPHSFSNRSRAATHRSLHRRFSRQTDGRNGCTGGR